MEFTFDTVYNQQAMTAIARALRRTIRKKHSRRMHIFGWIVIALVLVLSLPSGGEAWAFSPRMLVSWLAALAILIVLLFEDNINGAAARRRILAGSGRAFSTFREDGFCSKTQVGTTEWQYKSIRQLAETPDYFIFIFDQSHGQAYDKHTLSGGTADEFRRFIEEKTGLTVQQAG